MRATRVQSPEHNLQQNILDGCNRSNGYPSAQLNENKLKHSTANIVHNSKHQQGNWSSNLQNSREGEGETWSLFETWTARDNKPFSKKSLLYMVFFPWWKNIDRLHFEHCGSPFGSVYVNIFLILHGFKIMTFAGGNTVWIRVYLWCWSPFHQRKTKHGHLVYMLWISFDEAPFQKKTMVS